MLPYDLARRMIPTIHRIAHQLARRLPRHINIDDLVSAGYEGLVTAYTRFDPARGEGFEAYAEFRIRGAMLDDLRANDPLSRDQRAHANKIAAMTHALRARLGRAPASDEIAAELGITLEVYWQQLTASATDVSTSLDREDGFDAFFQVRDPHVEATDEHLCRKELKRAIHCAIDALPERLQRVIELHYGEGLTLREIGELFNVTESRVCQLRSEAIRLLRERCEEHTCPTDRSAPRPLPVRRANPLPVRRAKATRAKPPSRATISPARAPVFAS
jgi:RNA polymerase sigma factor FliA